MKSVPMNAVDDLVDRKINQHISHFFPSMDLVFLVHLNQRIEIAIAIDKQLYFEKLIKVAQYRFSKEITTKTF